MRMEDEEESFEQGSEESDLEETRTAVPKADAEESAITQTAALG
jgi:hypothetical protein